MGAFEIRHSCRVRTFFHLRGRRSIFLARYQNGSKRGRTERWFRRCFSQQLVNLEDVLKGETVVIFNLVNDDDDDDDDFA